MADADSEEDGERRGFNFKGGGLIALGGGCSQFRSLFSLLRSF